MYEYVFITLELLHPPQVSVPLLSYKGHPDPGFGDSSTRPQGQGASYHSPSPLRPPLLSLLFPVLPTAPPLDPLLPSKDSFCAPGSKTSFHCLFPPRSLEKLRPRALSSHTTGGVQPAKTDSPYHPSTDNYTPFKLPNGFPDGPVTKNTPANAGDAGDVGLIPESERPPGGENGNPLQSSCLENPMGRRAWRATVHGVTKELDTTEDARTRLPNNPTSWGL